MRFCCAALMALLLAGGGSALADGAGQSSCGDIVTTKGRYFVSSESAPCDTARKVVKEYLRDDAPRSGTVRQYRCTFNRNGTVAEGTAFKVKCDRGPKRIVGVYRGA